MAENSQRREQSDDRLKTPSGLWRDAFRHLMRRPLAIFGLVMISLLIIAAIFGPVIAPYDPNEINIPERFEPPSWSHPFGTDDFGRDIFSRVLYGARVSLKVGLIAVSLALIAGTILGLLSGYVSRILDEIIMRIMDVMFAFPTILLAILFMAALGRGIESAMVAIGIVYTPIFARIARGAVLSIREEEYVNAANAIGAGDGRILVRHILPNALAPLIVETTLSLAFAILAEAALSFFGLGVQPPDASWGRMLLEGRSFLRQSIWLGVFPGLAIMVTVMGFNFLGDGLRDALDPRMKGRR